jgi:hypothetical protein
MQVFLGFQEPLCYLLHVHLDGHQSWHLRDVEYRLPLAGLARGWQIQVRVWQETQRWGGLAYRHCFVMSAFLLHIASSLVCHFL